MAKPLPLRSLEPGKEAADYEVLTAVTGNNRQHLEDRRMLAEWQQFWTELQAKKKAKAAEFNFGLPF